MGAATIAAMAGPPMSAANPTVARLPMSKCPPLSAREIVSRIENSNSPYVRALPLSSDCPPADTQRKKEKKSHRSDPGGKERKGKKGRKGRGGRRGGRGKGRGGEAIAARSHGCTDLDERVQHGARRRLPSR